MHYSLKRVGEIYITIWQALGGGTCELWLLSSYLLSFVWDVKGRRRVLFYAKHHILVTNQDLDWDILFIQHYSLQSYNIFCHRSLYEVWAHGTTLADVTNKLRELSPSITVSYSQLVACTICVLNCKSELEHEIKKSEFELVRSVLIIQLLFN